jgi:hypothetical protein
MVVEKVEEVETCREYEDAPDALFQERVGGAVIPVAPLAGDRRVTGVVVIRPLGFTSVWFAVACWF